jgi:uncharacterized protein YqgC (DUF456 family)
MSESTSTPATADAHDEHHVHVYEHSGLREGNARVPLWLLVAIVSLFGFFAWYVASQWGAQPSTARMKSN